MKANELRVNNWCAFRDGYIQITANDLQIISAGLDKGEYTPIPLTPEILQKAKFIKVKNKIDVYEKGRIRLWIGGRGGTLAYLIEENTTTGHYIKNLHFVHEFQNFIYSLFGEELTINL